MNLIVFDIDDTLTHSEKNHLSAFLQAMKELGVDQINEDWPSYDHITDNYILNVNYQNNTGKPIDAKLIRSFEKRMTELMHPMPPVVEIPGAGEVLRMFSEHSQYAFTLATGSFHLPASLKLNQAGIFVPENLLVGSNQNYSREGIVTEAIQRAREHHGIEAFDQIISVGDGLWDLKTARNLDVHFMGIGKKYFREFKSEKVQYHIMDWNDFDLKKMEAFFEF